MAELTHHSFVAYTLPSTGEVVPMLQIAPSKTDTERLLLVSPELGEVLAEIIHRVRNGRQALPLVAAYDPYERTWGAPMPYLFQRQRGPEHHVLSRAVIRRYLNDLLAASGLTDAVEQPAGVHPPRLSEALRDRRPPLWAAAAHRREDPRPCRSRHDHGLRRGYPEDVVSHHRAFIARRRAQRPGEEYRDLTPEEWDQFLHHFELRKVALGVCTRDFGTPCAHEHSCVRCPQLRPDPGQEPRLLEIRDNLQARIPKPAARLARRNRRPGSHPGRRRPETTTMKQSRPSRCDPPGDARLRRQHRTSQCTQLSLQRRGRATFRPARAGRKPCRPSRHARAPLRSESFNRHAALAANVESHRNVTQRSVRLMASSSRLS